MWAELNSAGISQRFDSEIVGNHVAELDDFRHATEMLHEASRSAKGLPRQVVDGNLTVVQIGIGDARQILEDKILDDAKFLTHGGRADLLVVADDQHRLAKIQRDQRHDVALTSLVDDDHIEARVAGIEILNHPRERLDPYRYCIEAFGPFYVIFGSQIVNSIYYYLSTYSYVVYNVIL